MSGQEVDKNRRRFLVAATVAVGGAGVLAASVPFAASWWPSERAQAAGAPIEVDLSKLEVGQLLTVEWRGRPVWIIHRGTDVLDNLSKHDDELRDPASEVEQQPDYAKNAHRSIKPEYAVIVGICTHLGCVPTFRPVVGELNPKWPGGFFCPCHGSMFDMAGRVFKGVPAPINLEVPPYYFVNDHLIVIGSHSGMA